MSNANFVLVRLGVPQSIIVARALLPPPLGTNESQQEWRYATDALLKSEKFEDIDGTLLLELDSSTQVQEEDSDVTRIDSFQLATAVRTLAAATLLARHPQAESRRQNAAAAVSGSLLRGGRSLAETIRFISAVAEAAKDPQVKLRIKAAENASKRLENKQSVSGWPTLEKLFGPDLTAQLKYWLERLNVIAGSPPHPLSQLTRRTK